MVVSNEVEVAVGLAVVRSLGAPKRLQGAQDFEDFEQELVDQFLLASVGAGFSDTKVSDDRAAVFEFSRFLSRPLWTCQPADADGFLASQRKQGLARTTIVGKVGSLTQFFDFLVVRYQGDIHALTGHLVCQPIDEFNRPARAEYGAPRVPPAAHEVDALFSAWRLALPQARKYLPAARDYLAAWLWRRAGLRITESLMLDIRDWRADLGEFGKLHVRFGKGSRGRGVKTRLAPAINGVDALLRWWLTDVRHQFGDDWQTPDAPLLPSERRDRHTGLCQRVGDDALRAGLAAAVGQWLPNWSGRLTPHGLRHFCASSLYLQGMDLKAIQELLGHEWLPTTTRYIHVHNDHIEHAWAVAYQRVAGRLAEGGVAR
jgi:site-specific recombinase XerD